MIVIFKPVYMMIFQMIESVFTFFAPAVCPFLDSSFKSVWDLFSFFRDFMRFAQYSPPKIF